MYTFMYMCVCVKESKVNVFLSGCQASCVKCVCIYTIYRNAIRKRVSINGKYKSMFTGLIVNAQLFRFRLC